MIIASALDVHFISTKEMPHAGGDFDRGKEFAVKAPLTFCYIKLLIINFIKFQPVNPIQKESENDYQVSTFNGKK